jgi:hypothetical protein
MSSEIFRLESAPAITHYGDVSMMVHDPEDVILEPNHTRDGVLLMGTVPQQMNVRKDAKIMSSVRSAVAQVGADVEFTRVESDNTMWSVVVNSGYYSLLFEVGIQHNMGAIFSVEHNELTGKDLRRYYERFKNVNPQVGKESIAILNFENPVMWVETPTLLSTKDLSKVPQPINVAHLPSGSERDKIADFLKREVVARKGKTKGFMSHKDRPPFSIVQTETYIEPIDGFAFMIDGYAVIGKHNRIIQRGSHGDSRLVAQPNSTHQTVRKPHEIIAEIYKQEKEIVDAWREGYRIGFYGHPVRITTLKK